MLYSGGSNFTRHTHWRVDLLAASDRRARLKDESPGHTLRDYKAQNTTPGDRVMPRRFLKGEELANAFIAPGARRRIEKQAEDGG